MKLKLKEMLKKLQESKFLNDGDRIVIGFSGGPDSVFLFHLLKEYKKEIAPKLEIALAHVNHMLRGEAADYDEEFSRKIAKESGVEFYSRRVDIKKMEKELKKGAEELGREERYKFFEEVLKDFNGDKVALAHNKDDQIETFLFRLIRGTSLEGLEGIKERRDKYIRPVLNYYKEDILNYLHENSVPYTVDKTNFENEYTRNSIRLDLIPFMEKRYNPQAKEKIFQLIEEIKEVNNFLKIDLKNYLEGDLLLVNKILEEDIFIQKKIINKYLSDKGLKGDRYKINTIVSLLKEKKNKKISIEGGVFLKKEYNYLGIVHEEDFLQNNEKKNSKEITLKIEGNTCVTFGEYKIEISIEKNQKNEKKSKNLDIFCTNLKINDIITIRNRKEGDKFTPIGMKNQKKLKDFFINEKIPSELRDKIPLVLCNDEILWVSGIRGSELFKSNETTEEGNIIILKIRRE